MIADTVQIEAAALLQRSRAAQGLPPTIEDPALLEQVGTLIAHVPVAESTTVARKASA